MQTTRDHVLAATHLVLGPTNFLVLRLPTNWDVRIGRNPSEIDYTFAFEGIRWAQQGQAAAFLIDEKARRAMELDIRTSRGALRPPNLEGPTEGGCKMYGHPATFLTGVAQLGLFRNKRYQVLRVAYRCEDTQRNIVLQFTSKGDAKELTDILPVVAGSRCH